MKTPALIELYKSTVFILPNAHNLPDSFVILTAWNPQSLPVSKARNQSNNNQLEQLIAHYNYRVITGCSPDLTYQEPSFIIDMPKTEAYQLAIKFGQNAMFRIEEERLYIEPVLMELSEPVFVDKFEHRIIKRDENEYT